MVTAEEALSTQLPHLPKPGEDKKPSDPTAKEAALLDRQFRRGLDLEKSKGRSLVR